AELVLQLAGGRLAKGVIDRYPSPRAQTRIWVRPARVSAIVGTEIRSTEVEQRLESLGLQPTEGDAQRRLWAVPSWRRDLTREIDCVEEVARLRGYDTIPIMVPKAGVGETAPISAEQRITRAVRAALAARGFDEAVNYSFVSERELLALRPAVTPVRVANPLTLEQAAMRTTILAG